MNNVENVSKFQNKANLNLWAD